MLVCLTPLRPPLLLLLLLLLLQALIIGGGDGGLCTQVLQHDNIERVVLVDIDPQVVDVSVRAFPEFAACFADTRVQVSVSVGVEGAPCSRLINALTLPHLLAFWFTARV